MCEILGESLKSNFSQVVANCTCLLVRVCFFGAFLGFFETMDVFCSNDDHSLLYPKTINSSLNALNVCKW